MDGSTGFISQDALSGGDILNGVGHSSFYSLYGSERWRFSGEYNRDGLIRCVI